MGFAVNTNTPLRTASPTRHPVPVKPVVEVLGQDDDGGRAQHANGFGFDRRARQNSHSRRTDGNNVKQFADSRIIAQLAGQDAAWHNGQRAMMTGAYETAALSAVQTGLTRAHALV